MHEQVAATDTTKTTGGASTAKRPRVTGNTAPGGGRGFRRDIQGLRAIAVTMVVLYHERPSLLPGGFAGVDVFFVISGYLITGHLWREYRKTGRVSLLDFWGRRARRLIPAAALVLLVTWLAARLVAPATRLAGIGTQIRASALYFQNWQLAADAVNYLKSDSPATPVEHFWSLSVEEQFYLVWPLLFVIGAVVTAIAAGRRRGQRGGRAGGGRRAGLIAVAILTAALVASSLAYSVAETRSNPAAAYFVTTTRMWELGVGGLLAIAPDGFRRAVGRHGWLGWAGLAAVVASAFTLTGSDPFPGWLAVFPVGGSALLIACGGADARFGPAPLTSTRPMVFLGGISYSLYLWHYPLIDLYGDWRGKAPGMLTGPAIAAVAVLLAWLTKVIVEDKIRLSPRLAGHGWRSVSVALVAAVPAVLVSVYLATQAGWGGRLPATHYPGAAALVSTKRSSAPAKPTGHPSAEPVRPPLTEAVQDRPRYWLDHCLASMYSSTEKVCVFGDTSHPRLTVAMVGDSVDGSWFPALNEIAKKRHWKLITDLHGSCQWTATMMYFRRTKSPYTACHAWGKAALHDLITRLKPDLVITSGLPENGTPEHRAIASPAFKQIGAGMATYWNELESHGISVVAIWPTPLMNMDAPTCVAKYGRNSAKCATPTATAVLHDPPVARAARATGGKVKVINMNRFICGPQECKPVVGNVLVYFDRRHLTAAYAKTMTKYLEPRLLRAAPILAR